MRLSSDFNAQQLQTKTKKSTQNVKLEFGRAIGGHAIVLKMFLPLAAETMGFPPSSFWAPRCINCQSELFIL